MQDRRDGAGGFRFFSQKRLPFDSEDRSARPARQGVSAKVTRLIERISDKPATRR
jgi:hypothetical protein